MEDSKIFIKGRASLEEDKDGKVVCDQILTFEEVQNGAVFTQGRGGYVNSRGGYNSGNSYTRNQTGSNTPAAQSLKSSSEANRQGAQNTSKGLPEGVWVQFTDAADYDNKKELLQSLIADSDGTDDVVIFLKKEKGIKVLPKNMQVDANEALLEKLFEKFGQENVKIRRKAIENQ